jgi:hypothetical protein
MPFASRPDLAGSVAENMRDHNLFVLAGFGDIRSSLLEHLPREEGFVADGLLKGADVFQ